jgi:hypothetical protein
VLLLVLCHSGRRHMGAALVGGADFGGVDAADALVVVPLGGKLVCVRRRVALDEVLQRGQVAGVEQAACARAVRQAGAVCERGGGGACRRHVGGGRRLGLLDHAATRGGWGGEEGEARAARAVPGRKCSAARRRTLLRCRENLALAEVRAA